MVVWFQAFVKWEFWSLWRIQGNQEAREFCKGESYFIPHVWRLSGWQANQAEMLGKWLEKWTFERRWGSPVTGNHFLGESLRPEQMRYTQKSASRKVRVDSVGIRHPCLRDERVEGNRRKRGQNIKETAEGQGELGGRGQGRTSVQAEGWGRGSRAPWWPQDREMRDPEETILLNTQQVWKPRGSSFQQQAWGVWERRAVEETEQSSSHHSVRRSGSKKKRK